MMCRRLGSAVSVVLALVLGGCSGSVDLYHSFEGGAIAQDRQPPPGADEPYPNLANVPAMPPAQPGNEPTMTPPAAPTQQAMPPAQ